MKRNVLISFLLVFCMIVPFCSPAGAQKSQLKKFPQACNPAVVGKNVSQHFLPDKRYIKEKNLRNFIAYPEVCAWLGALRFAEAAKDKSLLNDLVRRFDPLFTTDKSYLPGKDHVDKNMFGCLPLEIYKVTKDKRYLELGLQYADTQWQLPENPTEVQKSWAAKNYTWQTRLWIDDMFMVTIVQAQASKVTGDRKYINRAAHEMVMYLDSLQCPNGLFYHAPDVPYFWGRGNGWMAAGMTELLAALPKSNPDRARILEGYHKMMSSLKDFRNKEGLWNQLIDKSDCWTETSGSAMFTYAMIMGVKKGWLEAKEYGMIAREAWISLVSHINSNYDVEDVCVGTNKKNDLKYYYDRPRVAGDLHGQAPVLWCAYALAL